MEAESIAHLRTRALKSAIMRVHSTMLLVLLASAFPSMAQAQEAVCKSGYERSQISRVRGKLLEAQSLLQQCSSATCSPSARKRCAASLADVEARLPSVILSAEDRKGVDLVDVAVSIDGEDGPRKLDGRAHDIDPGEHTLVFKLADGQKLERRVLVREGARGVSVPVTFGVATAAAASQAAPASAAAPGSSGDAALLAMARRTRSAVSPQKFVGFGAIGVGVVGLAVGAIFGIKASGTMSGPQCDSATKTCDPGVVDDAKTATQISSIAFVGGAALVAGGVALVILAPKRDNYSARLSAAPTVGVNGGGLSLGGAW